MSDKKIVIQYDEISAIVTVLIATLYFLISGIIIDGAVQIISFCIIIVCCFCFGRNKTVTKFDVLWILSVIPFFFSVKNWTVADVRDFIAYLAFIVFIVSTKVAPTSLNKAIKLLYVMAIFHLFFVLLNGIFRTRFNEFLYIIVSPKAITSLERAIKGNYVTGLGVIPGDTSGYLVNGILILIFGNFILRKEHKYLKALMLLIGILFCAKKSHLLCLGFSMCLTWIITAKNGKKMKRIVVVIMCLIAMVIVGYIILPSLTNIPMFNRISISLDKMMSGSDFTSNRQGLAKHAIVLFKERKTFGWGWKYFNKYTAERWGYTNYVNNVYLQLLVDTGVVGMVMFCMPMIYTFWNTLKNVKYYKNVTENIEAINYLTLSLVFQLFFLVYCFIEVPFYSYPFLMVYGMAVVISNSKLKRCK